MNEKIGPRSVHRYKYLVRLLLDIFALFLVVFFAYLYKRRLKFVTVKYQSLALLNTCR